MVFQYWYPKLPKFYLYFQLVANIFWATKVVGHTRPKAQDYGQTEYIMYTLEFWKIRV